MAPILDVYQDLRYAVRTLARSPGFTAAAALTLALGIGVSTAMFSVVNGVLLRGLPYRDAGRLANLFEVRDDGSFRGPSYPTFQDWWVQSGAAAAGGSGPIEGMAFLRGDGVMLRGKDGMERHIASYVTPGFFALMGTRPLLGRTWLPDEERRGANPVTVLSYDLWQQHFGGDPAAIGRVIDLDSIPTTIIGVMPHGFNYPSAWGSALMLWEPIAVFEAAHQALSLRGLHADSRTIVRMRSGADSARVAAALRTIETRLASAYPVEQGHWTSVGLQPLRDEELGNVSTMLWVLSGAVGLVLLLACANVAGLILVRAASRARELAVRSALGAGGLRIARQLFAENLVLALGAGAIGVGLAYGTVAVVGKMAAQQLPRADQVRIDPTVLLFAFAASIGAALLTGLVPAVRAAREDVFQRLRAGVLGSVGAAHEGRARSALVGLQFAVALVMLVGSGLLIQSFRHVESVPLGYEPNGVDEAFIQPPQGRYGQPAQAADLYHRLLDAVAAVPGVEAVGLRSGNGVTSPVVPEGQPVTNAKDAIYLTTSPGYLRAMRIPMRRGRWFTEGDMRAPNGFVINEKLAKALFPSGSALGQRIIVKRASQVRKDFGQPMMGPVIGVIEDVHRFGRETDPLPEIYVPYTLETWAWASLTIRTVNPERAAPALRRAILSVDPTLPVDPGNVSPMSTGLASQLAPRRLTLSIITAFALCALGLAAIGMYGVVAFSVAQRTREVGIRVALGATERTVVLLVMGEGARLALLGGAVGLLAAFATSRLIRSLLFQTGATDLATFVTMPLVLGAVALLASWVPARRAARLDPVSALRAE